MQLAINNSPIRIPSRTNPGGSPVPGIAPVDGWRLFWLDEEDSDGFLTTAYYAARGGEVRYLNTSRFAFFATQPRFDWMVRNGFPGSVGGRGGPITSDAIDAELARALPVRDTAYLALVTGTLAAFAICFGLIVASVLDGVSA